MENVFCKFISQILKGPSIFPQSTSQHSIFAFMLNLFPRNRKKATYHKYFMFVDSAPNTRAVYKRKKRISSHPNVQNSLHRHL